MNGVNINETVVLKNPMTAQKLWSIRIGVMLSITRMQTMPDSRDA